MLARLTGFALLMCAALAAPNAVFAQGTSTPALSPEQEAREEIKNQADAAYRSGQYAESIRLLDQVLAQDAKDHVALYLRGSAKVEKGAAEKDPVLIRSGVTDARTALGINFNVDYYLPYLYGMSRLSEVEGRPEHASSGVGVVDKVLGMGKAVGDQKANLYFQRHLLNQAIGDKTAAKQDLRNAIAAAPKHLAAQTALCNLIYSEGNPQASEKQFDATVAALPDQPLVYNNRGNFLQSVGRYDEAIRDYSKAIELDPNHIPSLTSKGYVEIMQQKYAAAEADLTKSLEVDAKQPTAFSLRAMARMNLGQVDAAIQDYQTVSTLTPNVASAFYDLGFAQFCDRDYPAAQTSFDQALRLEPSIPFLAPWRYTAMVFANQRDKAVAEFSAVERRAENERTWFDVLTLFLMGKVDETAVFAAVDKSKPETTAMQTCEANYFVGLRYASRNQPDQARQFFEKSIATGQRHLASYRGAMYALGKFAAQ
jgi:tetratricopeptide (TPR) repeat protein